MTDVPNSACDGPETVEALNQLCTTLVSTPEAEYQATTPHSTIRKPTISHHSSPDALLYSIAPIIRHNLENTTRLSGRSPCKFPER